MPIKEPSPGPVPKEALEYFRKKGIKPGFSYLSVWKEEHNFAFTVAKVMEQDILADIRTSIEIALREGKPFAEWQKDVKPLFDASGWSDYGTEATAPYRLKRIYQTNMRVARAVGQWQRIQRTKRALPYLMYQLGPSEKHRPEHAAWDGLILPVDDPFWVAHYPPNGYGCKCRVIQLTRSETERRGGPSEAPVEELIEWTNASSGEKELVPKGIHPAFNFNPGMVEERRRVLEQRLKDGPPSWSRR